ERAALGPARLGRLRPALPRGRPRRPLPLGRRGARGPPRPPLPVHARPRRLLAPHVPAAGGDPGPADPRSDARARCGTRCARAPRAWADSVLRCLGDAPPARSPSAAEALAPLRALPFQCTPAPAASSRRTCPPLAGIPVPPIPAPTPEPDAEPAAPAPPAAPS